MTYFLIVYKQSYLYHFVSVGLVLVFLFLKLGELQAPRNLRPHLRRNLGLQIPYPGVCLPF